MPQEPLRNQLLDEAENSYANVIGVAVCNILPGDWPRVNENSQLG